MSIISKETWDKFTQEEKEAIKQDYQEMLDGKTEFSEEAKNAAIFQMEWLIGKENLQPKPLTYGDVARELFKDKEFFIYDSENDIIVSELRPLNKPINCTSRKQAEKLLAINKLLNVAKFLNKDWKPDWENEQEAKWYIEVWEDEINTDSVVNCNSRIVHFRTEELAKQAIQILGEDTVRLALTTEY